MGRYDNITQIDNKKFKSIGTSYLPKFQKQNSDI